MPITSTTRYFKKTWLSSEFVVFLLAFFSRMVIRMVGEFSVLFVFSAVTLLWWYRRLDFKHDKDLRFFTRFFYALVAINIIWMPFSHGTTLELVKSMMIPVNGALVFLYFYYAFRSNPAAIKYFLLGSFLSMFVFAGQLIENFDIEEDSYNYWKFLEFPRIVSGVIAIYALLPWRWLRKNIALVFIALGALGFATGARSAGLIPFLAGVIALMAQQKVTSAKRLKYYLIGGLVLIYAAYALLYVPNVMNGNIAEGNSEQLQHTVNPYNPLALLMVGRADAIVPFIAFLDNPLFGWGTNAMDPGYKYTILSVMLSDGTSIDRLLEMTGGKIPGHSQWGVYACYYGIVGFMAFLLMMARTWKLIYRSLKTKNENMLLILYLGISFSWNILFSPGALKSETAYLAGLLALIANAVVQSKTITKKEESA